MAISEDLRSVQAMLGSPAMASQDERQASILRLACDNLRAMAEQVEALEELPLTASAGAMPGMSPLFGQDSARCQAPLQ